MQCRRGKCVTCNQGGEETLDSTRATVVYESICVRCNQSVTNKGELKDVKQGAPGLYIGESSRSIQEYALERCAAARKGDTDSHKASRYGAPRGAVPVLVQSGCHTQNRLK